MNPNGEFFRGRRSLLLLFLVVFVAFSDWAQAADAKAPNVVLILVDDLGWADLGCQGSEFYETPNIDRLAAQGMRFTQAYAACAVCSPTRAAVMTGRYPARVGVTDWIRARFQGGKIPENHTNPTEYVGGPNDRVLCPPNPLWMEHGEVTVAELLKERGYVTCHIGKWHLGPDEWYPDRQGFDDNIGGCDFGQPPSYFDPYENPRQGAIPTLEPRLKNEYLTDREGDEAEKFIRKHRKDSFFLHYAPYAVHTPIQAKPQLTARYEGKAKTDQSNAKYAAMIQSVDEAVGRIMTTLDELKLAGNTLVIFTSDNGGLDRGGNPTDNAPLRSGKGYPYEGGIRVPFIVRWPGKAPAGRVSDAPVISMDCLPTILEAAGGELPEGRTLDGLSLLAHLKSGGREALQRDSLFWHFPHYRGRDVAPYSIIRKGGWKLIKRYDGKRFELFDLKSDPGERNDLASSRAREVLALNAELEAHLEEVGARVPRKNPDYGPDLRAVKKPGGVEVREGRDRVMFYQAKTKSLKGKSPRANYVHPLFDLDGHVLTEDFPEDHLHHRGIFWAWHYLAVDGEKVGDPWTCKDIVWDVDDVRIDQAKDGNSVTLRAEVEWKSPLWKEGKAPLVKETTAITVHRAGENARSIDFEIRLLAAVEKLRIGGSEDVKGYGGFSPRIELHPGLRFTGPGGEVQPKNTAVEGGPWMDVHGMFSEEVTVRGLAMLQHPDNPGFPQKWILRRQRSMQNPMWPGNEPVALSTTDPTVLRYRLVIHRGTAREARIDRLQKAYEAETGK